MPCAQKIDPRLIKMIPQETLNKFEIQYEEDDFHIKSWVELDGSYSRSSNSDHSSNDESGSEGSEQSGSSSGQDISANSQAIGDSSEQDHVYGDEEDASQIDADVS